MAGKPGFMMYHDGYHALDALDDAAHRRVMDAMCEYSETGRVTVGLIGAEMAVFAILKNKLDADWERYQSRVEAGRKGGIRSGEARRSNMKQDEANSSNAKQHEATSSKTKQDEANEPTITIPIPITVTPTITPTITIGNSSNSCTPGDGEEEFPPSVGRVREYIVEHGLGVSAEEFLARCEAAGWTDGSGQPVRDWRMWLKGYAIRTAKPESGRAGRLGADPRLAAFEAMKGVTG